MDVKWTLKQQQVIDTKGKNLLVSAAAGSGKTAVLVERIIRLITDSKNPMDIDKLLVVTFTNAAAAQMRERIAEAVRKKSEEDPENEHLQRQQTLIHNARITTIHSFCLNVIREHFNDIEIDPGFKVGDEGELTLLKSDMIGDLLEDYYGQAGEDFFEFIETYASGRGDANIEELILKLYGFSVSYPWPEKWLDFCEENYLLKEDALFDSPWMQHLLEYIDKVLGDYYIYIENAMKICRSPEGPYMYEDALQEDMVILNQVKKTRDYDERVQLLTGLKFTALSRKRDETVSPQKKEEVKALRKKVKDGISSLAKNFYFQCREDMMEGIRGSAGSTKVLIGLVKEFSQRFAKAKRDSNIIDFNDIEHLAFQILVDTKESGETAPSRTAQELAGYFEEIIIDEYQDSNLLQELILKSVSKEQSGCPNIFMVGDVKQSIYKFRMARPELFVEKYDNYSLSEDSPYQRINLDMNFRSRDNILKSINYIFMQIMARNLGDIEYDEENALYTGAQYKELPEGQRGETEILLAASPEGGKELEAEVIARRIQELVDSSQGELVIDGKTGEYRRAEFRDIVILYRSLNDQAPVIEETLMNHGIPCYVESKQGYFNAMEIRIILSLLSIIDNPIQDIPLAAVLKSPIGGLTSMDLAQIKAEHPSSLFYHGARMNAAEGADNRLQEKLNVFFSRLEEYRRKSAYLTIYELLTYVLNDTGYYLYVSAMPSGDRRKANIDMLKEKAAAYEKTSYKGVFNFIRYIEKLKKYKVDFAEANLTSENDDTVRIMSIHKSKGLEFPIVFLGGMGKKFNTQDLTGKIVLHSEYGIGVDHVDTQLRTKEQTLIKKSIALKLKLENLGEELRVLYVAMTRAKEKLIMTGTVKNLEKRIQKWQGEQYNTIRNLSFETLISSSDYMDWVLSALARHPSFMQLSQTESSVSEFLELPQGGEAGFLIRVLNPEEILYEKVKEHIQRENLKENLLHWNLEYTYEKDKKEELVNRLEFSYPYGMNRHIYTKMSVSEIKRQSQLVDNEFSSPIMEQEQIVEEIVPVFVSKKEEMTPENRGNAYHRVLQLLKFSQETDKESIQELIHTLAFQKKITQKEAETVEASSLAALMHSDLGRRMTAAYEKGVLYREQQYIMGIPASHINPAYPSDETVLIQGILDAFFEEEEELVIVDYKTDRVRTPGQLADRYKVQLDYYEKALSQLTGKKVKEKIIYSLFLGKEVIVK